VPTILRISGYRVMMFHNDHPPAHVHVFNSDGEALIYLNCPTGPPHKREKYRLSEADVGRLLVALRPHISQLCATWEEMHGNHP